ncbi:MAG TPA: hypothetical protein ENF44_03560 [Deltaproteobacteria bacterium]|nr:hypothetical protein [Deltaproteobacteria bacterium]
MEGERRESIRVLTYLPFEARVVDPSEAQELRERCILPEGGTGLFDVEETLKHSNLPPALAHVLCEMNRKLDLLLCLVSSGEEWREMAGGERRKVEVSGTGLGFFWDEALPSGTLMEVKFLLPTLPFRPIRALVEVVRAEERRGRVWLGVKFTALREEDREEIVRFAFIKQKELLRQRS